MKSRVLQLLIGAVVFALVLFVIDRMDTQDLATERYVFLYHYAPVFLAAALTMFFRQFWAAHILLGAAELGLIVEYVLNTLEVSKTLRIHGASYDAFALYGYSVNLMILFAGLILGIVLQIAVNLRRKRRQRP